MEKKPRYKYVIYSLLFLMVVLFIAIYTFILQKSYRENTLEEAVTRDIACSDAIHQVVSNRFSREDYDEINTVEDMQTSRYQELQKSLNELRTLNSTRYLYTAKRNEEGRLIYLIDGLDLGAEDFAYPGTYIEEEMIPYIDSALAGETVYSQEIMDTTWGHIFTACYPVREEGSGDIIGALCIEIDMEDSYRFLEASNRNSIGVAVVAILVAVILSICVWFVFRKQKARERKQQRLLEETARAAQAASEAKSAFLFNMSHDIRTPMNAIIGYAQLAENHLQEPDKLKEYSHNIHLCGQRLLAILDNVLELARIENNETVIEAKLSRAGEIFEACRPMFSASLEEKKQTMTMEKEILYPYIYMDTAHVTEIVLNIVSNAIKYTPEGGSIHCSLHQKPGEKDGWCQTEIIVRDNGIGISKEFQKHIFESFSRERSSTVSGVEGSGLGMGIVKHLVDRMQGTIQVESEPGQGSTFTICIPCRIATPEEVKSQTEALQDMADISGKRILLAEDNDLNAEIAQEILKEEGLVTERAVNGENCVQMLEKSPDGYYQAVLMDIQMPVMDGYEAARRIRQMADPAKATIPIIAMTANAFMEDRQKALESGMNDHVAKPVDMKVLLPMLQKYIQK